MTNLGDDTIRTGEGVTFIDGDIGFGSLKLVLQFTTVFTPSVLILRPFALNDGFNRTGQLLLFFCFCFAANFVYRGQKLLCVEVPCKGSLCPDHSND